MLIATENLKEQAIEKSGIENLFETNFWYNFAYTDYGGDFWDKVCIRYFRENYPDNFVHEVCGWNGENGILFNTQDNTNLVEDFREATEKYLLGFGDLESFYSEIEYEQTEQSFKYFLEDTQRDYFVKAKTLDYLVDHYMGDFSMLPNDLDFCHEDLQKNLLEENLIFNLYGNDLFETLIVLFDDVETELSKENNILCSNLHLPVYEDVEQFEFDLQDIENFFGCTFSVNQYNDFCVNWNE